MSDKERIDQRNVLNSALRDSFRMMLEEKKKLGLPVVTSDKEGNPVVLTAEEAEKLVGGN